LGDKKRSGRPPRFTPVQVAEVTALACQLPAESNTPLSRWSCPDLAREAVARGVADALSASTVRRWLDQHAIKPWQHRSWIFIRDPDFADSGEAVTFLGGQTQRYFVVSLCQDAQAEPVARAQPGPGS
jgi:hypothetical protein